MELVYANDQVEKICTSKKAALKHFGGNNRLVLALFSKIQALEAADALYDLSILPSFHLHPLKNKGRNKLKGYFAIDVKGRSNAWRLIFQPLDDHCEPFACANIDEIARVVRIVQIEQVSKHYE